MPLEFSAQSKQRVDKALAQYPTKQAALLPVLHIAQDQFGHLPDEVLELVAKTLELPPAHVFGVITFYTMFHREKHGRNELMVCTNVSCMLRGAYDILGHIEKKLGIKAGETTPDGAFAIVEEECLAACANAPMMICGNEYFLDLTPEKVDVVLDDLRKRWQANNSGGHGGTPPTGKTPTGPTRTLFGVGPAPDTKA
ncbi:MAG TPA: NAD(P)H-dependent oxidoreductase subunit E [Polyangia bacterium]|nr:NAD(P)H-dependent oxidoreductase subunit E [Polyangia bacterium]